MGNNLSTNNDFFANLNTLTVKDPSTMEIDSQKKELNKLFTTISENNASADDKKAMKARLDVIRGKVEKLESRMASLEEDLAKKQKEVEEAAEGITSLVERAKKCSERLKKEQKDFMKDAWADVMQQYKDGEYGPNEIFPEFMDRLKKKGTSGAAKDIEEYVSILAERRDELQPLIESSTKVVGEIKSLEKQYGFAKSSFKLLNSVYEQIGATGTTYTNNDVDTTSPIYSIDKLELLSNFTDNVQLNVPPTNTNYGNGVNTVEKVNEKHKDCLNVPTTEGMDINGFDNVAVQKLGEAIDNGLLNDLAATGMGNAGMIDFLANNFAGAGIGKKEDGTLFIPEGHQSNAEKEAGIGDNNIADRAAAKVYNKIADFFNNFGKTPFLGVLNTWDENAGNTISSNSQLEALSGSYAYILETMHANGFTFKETMHALFNKDIGLFKDCGITYDLSQQGDEACYNIADAGDVTTATFYSNFSQKVIQLYGVEANAKNKKEPVQETPVERTDPVTFIKDGKEYAFVIDRNNDGKFSGSEEFIGATGDIKTDFKSLDKNKDGKLSGNELKNLKVFVTGYQDNKETKKEREYNGQMFMSSQTTEVSYALTNAQALDISSIDLDNVVQNGSTGKKDANNSLIYDDTVKFKMNGKEITAQRKDDTTQFLKTIYDAAKNKNFELGLDEDKVNNTIDETYEEFDEMHESYNDVIENIGVIMGTDQLTENTRDLFNATTESLDDEKGIYKRRANNAATAEDSSIGWNRISSAVRREANNRGISIDMAQAKGIYMLTSAETAEEVVDEYENMLEDEKDIIKNQENITIAWHAIILCVKAGVEASADEILDILNDDEASTAQEVVDYLLEEKGRTLIPDDIELDLDDERTQEILAAFKDKFGNGALDKLHELCVAQQKDRSFMLGKSAYELVEAMD